MMKRITDIDSGTSKDSISADAQAAGEFLLVTLLGYGRLPRSRFVYYFRTIVVCYDAGKLPEQMCCVNVEERY